MHLIFCQGIIMSFADEKTLNILDVPGTIIEVIKPAV